MHWKTSATKAEGEIAKNLRSSSKFYRFLWSIRGELFDEAFQRRLMKAYAPRGQEPCPPAQVAMATLLQRYAGLSDAAAVDAAENDKRWQLVLGTVGHRRAPFGQGSLVRYRARAIEHDLDRALLDRTIELAKTTRRFGWKKLRVIFDSSPLEGAGRVEDTWNLIGRAMGKVVAAVGHATGTSPSSVVRGAGLTVLQADSVKAALDIDWSDTEQRHEALQLLLDEAARLESWVRKEMKLDAERPPVSEALDLLRQVVKQDLEPDPEGGGRRIRDGVAHDRVISIGDTQMRHGRKSRSRTINGYKRHIVTANRFILGGVVEPANRPEHAATGRLLTYARRHGRICCAHFDRGYLPAPEIAALWKEGVELHSRAYRSASNGNFGKERFTILLKDRLVICPAGHLAQASPTTGQAHFREQDCQACPLKSSCTRASHRSVTLHPNEDMLLHFRREQASSHGRLTYRERTPVEHRLARVDAIQGSKARYVGVRKNEFDLCRTAALANLQELARLRRAA